MQKEELIKEKYEDEELAELIEKADDEQFLELNIDKLIGIVNIANKKVSSTTDILDDDERMETKVKEYNDKNDDAQISYEDVLKTQKMSNDIFANRDITRADVRRYLEEQYYIKTFSNIFQNVRPLIPSFVRDVSRYVSSLQIEDPVSRLKAFLKYAKAIKQREKGDYTIAREIEKNLLKAVESGYKVGDIKAKDGLYNHMIFANKVFVFSEMLNDDKEFKKQYKESNPKDFYTFSVTNIIIENQLYLLSKEIGIVTGLHTEDNELQSKGAIGGYAELAYKDDIRDDDVKINNSVFSLTRAYLKSISAGDYSTKLDLNVAAYGLDYTKDNNKFEYFGDMDIDDIYDSMMKAVYPEGMGIDVANKTQLDEAVVHGQKILTNYVNTLDGAPFIKEIANKDETKDFIYQSIYVGDKSIYDLAKEHMKETNADDKDFEILASSYFVKALNDPKQTISLVTYKMDDKGLTNSVITLEKNYDKLIDNCKKSHGFFDKFMHIFNKYPEEKMVETYAKTKAKYEQSFARTDILNDFNEKHKDQISKFNKPFIAALEKKQDDKQVIKNIEINEVKEIKEVKEVANDNIVKENGMGEKEL